MHLGINFNFCFAQFAFFLLRFVCVCLFVSPEEPSIRLKVASDQLTRTAFMKRATIVLVENIQFASQ